MIRFFRDILVYPLLVIQLIVVGPFLYAQNDGGNNNDRKQRNTRSKADERYRKSSEQSKGSTPNMESHTPSKYNSGATRRAEREKRKRDRQQNRDQKAKEAARKRSIERSKKEQEKQWAEIEKEKEQAEFERKEREYTMGPVEEFVANGGKDFVNGAKGAGKAIVNGAVTTADVLTRGQTRDSIVKGAKATREQITSAKQKAIAAFRDLVRKSEQEVKDEQKGVERYVEKSNGKETYRVIDKENNTTVVTAIPAKEAKTSTADYYKGRAHFVATQIDNKLSRQMRRRVNRERLELEYGSPTYQLISHDYVHVQIRANFIKQFNHWVDQKGYGQHYSTLSLAEQYINMYLQSAKAVLTQGMEIEGTRVQIDPNVFNKKYEKEFRNLLESRRTEVLNFAQKTFHMIKHMKGDSKHTVGLDFALKKTMWDAPLWKSMRLLPIETFYFTLAMLAATVMQLGFDETSNPLWREDAVHHFFEWKGHVGFWAFILANQKFQAVAPKLNYMIKKATGKNMLKQWMRGYIGMGVGSIASHWTGEVLNHPAFSSWWNGKVKAFNASSEEEAAQWNQIADYSQQVLIHEFTSGKFWQKQFGQVTALLGSSFAAAMVSKGAVFASKSLNFKDKARFRMEAVNAFTAEKAAKSQAQKVTAKAALVATTGSRKILSDIGWAATRILGSTPAGKLWHFTAFLVADPFVRPMVRPFDKHVAATEASNKVEKVKGLLAETYESIDDLKSYTAKERQLLKAPVNYNRLTMDLDSEASSLWSLAKPFAKSLFNGGNTTASFELSTAFSRYWNSRDDRELEDFFRIFRDYGDAKFQYRYVQLENFNNNYQGLSRFMDKFTLNYVSTQEMYTNFETAMDFARDRQIMAAEENRELPLTDEFFFNLLNYPAYYSLHEESRDIFDNYLSILNTAERGRSSAFDEFDFMEWQTELGQHNLDGLSSAAYAFKIKSPENLSGNPKDEHFIYFRNGTAERMLYGMAFGPSPESGDVFDVPWGYSPEFEYPRVTISNLGFNPELGRNMELDMNIAEVGASATVTGSDYAGKPTYGAKAFYHPLTSVRWKVPVEFNAAGKPTKTELMSIFEIILRFKRPELHLGGGSDLAWEIGDSSSNYNKITMSDYLTKEVFCKSGAQKLENIGKNCASDSMESVYEEAEHNMKSFYRDIMAPVFTRESHQANSKFSRAVSAMNYLFFNGLSPKWGIMDTLGWTIEAEQGSGDGLETSATYAKGNLADINIGAESPVLSVIEDFIVGTGFISFILPRPSDFDPKQEPEQYARAKAYGVEKYAKFLKDSYSTITMNYIDYITATKATGGAYNSEQINKAIDKIEESYNSAICYIHGRNPAPADAQNDGIVTIKLNNRDDRFYRRYDKNDDVFVYTKIEKNHQCDVDQIQHRIETIAAEEEDNDIPHRLEKIGLDEWVKNFEVEGKEPLSPATASPEALQEQFNIESNQELFGKIFDLLVVGPSNAALNPQGAFSVIAAQQANAQSAVRHEMLDGHPFLKERGRPMYDYIKDEPIEEFVQNEAPTDAQQMLQNIMQAENLESGKIRIQSSDVAVPRVSMRTAIASKSVQIIRDAMYLEGATYQKYFMKLRQYGADVSDGYSQLDSFTLRLCEIRGQLAAAYTADNGVPVELAGSTSLCNSPEYIISKNDLKNYWSKYLESLPKKFSGQMGRSKNTAGYELSNDDIPQYWRDRIRNQLELEKKYGEDYSNNFSKLWWKLFPAFEGLFN